MLTAPERLVFEVPDSDQSGKPHRIVCHAHGNPDAAHTVLCVHGLTRNGRDFDYLASSLAGDYRVLCPDMPGRGESQWLSDPRGYSYPSYVADLFAIFDQLSLKRLHWIGTSMGGIIGMMAANARPGLIDALVLNDIGASVSAVGLRRIMAYAGSDPAYATPVEALAALRARCASFGIRDEAHWRHFFEHSFQSRPDGLHYAYDPAIIAGVTPESVAQDIDLWQLWEGVTPIPVLLIRGAESDLLTAETARAMQARHTRLTLKEIPHAGHAPALMEDVQLSLIADWLKTQEQTPA